jgi:hypothetical protein
MSRSRRKTPVLGITTAKSEKQDKRIANRKLRRAVKQRLGYDPDGVLPALREVSNVWSMDKDGKVRYFRSEWEAKPRRDPWWKLMLK